MTISDAQKGPEKPKLENTDKAAGHLQMQTVPSPVNDDKMFLYESIFI